MNKRTSRQNTERSLGSILFGKEWKRIKFFMENLEIKIKNWFILCFEIACYDIMI